MSLRANLHGWLSLRPHPDENDVDELLQIISAGLIAGKPRRDIDGGKQYSGSDCIEIGGEDRPVFGVQCVGCLNHFWVPDMPENAPSFCPYCGGKFQSTVGG
jgi:hypothetical protein